MMHIVNHDLPLKSCFKVKTGHHFVRNRPYTLYIAHILHLFQRVQSVPLFCISVIRFIKNLNLAE